MNCPKCNELLTIEETQTKKFVYCLTCYETFSVEGYDPFCCKNPTLIKVRHKLSNNVYNIRDQCQNCGKIYSKSYSHKSYNIESLSDSNIEFYISKRNSIENDYQEKRNWFFKKKEEDYAIDKIYPDYSEYLKSQEWKIKRELVFKRDKNICQSCFKNKAEQVHHLNYIHIFNEPLFDLVSICSDCHNIITKMEKGIKEIDKIVH